MTCSLREVTYAPLYSLYQLHISHPNFTKVLTRLLSSAIFNPVLCSTKRSRMTSFAISKKDRHMIYS